MTHNPEPASQYAILVHGGAGGWLRGGQPLIDAAMGACEEAARAGFDAMTRGGSALDAVEAAVRVMEDAPMLNAGRGSLPNRDGIIELDAMIMDGATLGAGAVAAVQRVRNPISLARRVMSDTPHVLLVGEGASAFADSIGFPRCTDDDLRAGPPGAAAPRDVSDTVGAVAIDGAGNLACATSTGGVPRKMAGRVGDSPIPGAGGYADNETAAVSATGDGEAFIKLTIARYTCAEIERGMSAQAACDAAMALLARRMPEARGGLIAIDRAGHPGWACNTEAMPRVFLSSDGRAERGWR